MQTPVKKTYKMQISIRFKDNNKYEIEGLRQTLNGLKESPLWFSPMQLGILGYEIRAICIIITDRVYANYILEKMSDKICEVVDQVGMGSKITGVYDSMI